MLRLQRLFGWIIQYDSYSIIPCLLVVGYILNQRNKNQLGVIFTLDYVINIVRRVGAIFASLSKSNPFHILFHVNHLLRGVVEDAA